MLNNLFKRQTILFLTVGAVNTGLTFALYFLLCTVINYQIAYLIAYIMGICCSYFLNALFVFKQTPSINTLIRFPFVYLIQYLTSAFLLEVFVKIFFISQTTAPFLIIIFTIPLTYLLSRLVFNTQKIRTNI